MCHIVIQCRKLFTFLVRTETVGKTGLKDVRYRQVDVSMGLINVRRKSTGRDVENLKL